MAIAGATTTISAASSAATVMAMLAKKKARQILLTYDEAGDPVALSFTIDTEFGERGFQLPVRHEGVLATLKRDGVAKRLCTPEHALKVAWRIAHDWLRAQLAIIDSGLVSMPEVLFPYMLMGDTPAYEQYIGHQKELGQ